MGVGNTYMVSAQRTRRVSVTIPKQTDPAVTMQTLCEAADPTLIGLNVIGYKVCALIAAGTDRPAVKLGDTAATMLQAIGAGVEVNEPSVNDYKSTFIEALADTAITVPVVLYIG